MTEGGMILHQAEDGEVDEATITSQLIVRTEGDSTGAARI